MSGIPRLTSTTDCIINKDLLNKLPTLHISVLQLNSFIQMPSQMPHERETRTEREKKFKERYGGGQPLVTGWLLKQSKHDKTFKRRYCELTERGRLLIYKDVRKEVWLNCFFCVFVFLQPLLSLLSALVVDADITQPSYRFSNQRQSRLRSCCPK